MKYRTYSASIIDIPEKENRKRRGKQPRNNLRKFPGNEAHEFPNELKGPLRCLQWIKGNTYMHTRRQILSSETEKIPQASIR